MVLRRKSCSRQVRIFFLAVHQMSIHFGVFSGARVVANDLKTERLEEISRSLNADERGRLTLAPGDALQLVIPSASLGGILATRWINVLRPYECRLLMNDFYRWLAPGGILCITAHTPYSNTTKGNS